VRVRLIERGAMPTTTRETVEMEMKNGSEDTSETIRFNPPAWAAVW
jgi:hypothetical protein